MTMYCETLFGKSSDLYETLLNQGLVSDAYGFDMHMDDAHGYLMIGSETTFPDKLQTALRRRLESLSDYRVDQADFLRTKRQILGSFTMGLDSLEDTAHRLARYLHEDLLLYELIEIVKDITYDEVQCCHKYIDIDQSVFVKSIPK